jgi:hypothetical protein
MMNLRKAKVKKRRIIDRWNLRNGLAGGTWKR